VQRAGARNAEKRGGGAEKIALDESVIADHTPAATGGLDVLALDSALEKLAALDSQQAKIVELRYFGGMTVEEVAEALDISPATVKRHWTVARAWLHKELSGGPVAP
jgi:RNA polymerase sigma factor (TIGR02999 family)